MLNKFAAIIFVDEPRLCEAACMFPYCFFVCINGFDNTIERKTAMSRDK